MFLNYLVYDIRQLATNKCAQWDFKCSNPGGPGPGYRVSVEGHEGFQVKVALPNGQTLDSLDPWISKRAAWDWDYQRVQLNFIVPACVAGGFWDIFSDWSLFSVEWATLREFFHQWVQLLHPRIQRNLYQKLFGTSWVETVLNGLENQWPWDRVLWCLVSELWRRNQLIVSEMNDVEGAVKAHLARAYNPAGFMTKFQPQAVLCLEYLWRRQNLSKHQTSSRANFMLLE